MTEFKQIIGRGTRLYPELGKEYFTIIDFRGVCRLFADPAFDGEPVVVIDGGDGGDEWDPADSDILGGQREQPESPEGLSGFNPPAPIGPLYKYRVRGVPVDILNERVHYFGNDGKLITESLNDYSKRNILAGYETLDDFLTAWTKSERKQAIINELNECGVFFDELKKESGKDLDDFDLILHVAYDKKPLTRQERANNVKKKGYLYKYSKVCQQVLSALLDKYMTEGINELEDTRILDNAPFDRIGSPKKIAQLFGGKEGYIQAVRELTQEIYQTA